MTESVDFHRRSETAVDQFVSTAIVQLEDKSTNQLEAFEQDVDDYIPADLLKPYYYGIGTCHPKWLQMLANKKFFTALLCLFAFIQGSLVSGFTSVVLSTIQTRYQFTSSAVGFIAVSYDVTVMISVVFISYFGGKQHRSRWLGASLIVIGIGALVFASPQFLFGKYKAGSRVGLDLELCNDDRNITVECTISNDLAYMIYIFGNILVGIGAAPLYTVGVAYIDELVFPKYVPIHFGVFQMISVLGPAFGYGVGSAFLSLYVDPWEDTVLITTDPSWVGAWWIPFILIACFSFLLAVPFLMFPKWLPDSRLVRKERAKEMAMIYEKKYINEDSMTIIVKMFPIHIKQLLTNVPFIFHTISLSFLFILISGFVSFAPKFFQNQFQLTATIAGLLSGGIGITAAAIGTITGGIILYLTKLRGKKLALFITVVIATMIPITPSFLLNCPSLQVAGISVPYPNGIQSGRDSSQCSMNCSCTYTVFEPVCGNDGVTYFSPCRAGCDQREEMNFTDCLCIADNLKSIYSNISYDDVVANYSMSVNGRCDQSCSVLIPFIIIMLITFFLVFIIQIPISYFTVRVVADDQRSLALGLSSAVYRVFGTVPGPLLFGVMFDASCIDWQNDCGRRGNCWVYDNDKLSLSVLGFSAPCLTFSAFFFFLALLTFPKKQQQQQQQQQHNTTNDIENIDNAIIDQQSNKRFSLSSLRRLSNPISPRRLSIPISPRQRTTESTCSEDILLDSEKNNNNEN